MDQKQNLIQQILEIEQEMFISVPTEQEYNCQQDTESFKLHRTAQFVTWSSGALSSYLGDLEKARADEKNLMTIKYARMDDLIPRENHNPLVEKIAAIQYAWQKEMFSNYPAFMKGARPLDRSQDVSGATSFETYLTAELETYSDATLSLLYQDFAEKQSSGRNMAEESYEYLVRRLGYDNLDQVEERLRKGAGPSADQ
jgi:hypothetical protein